jgi:HlyD family secretion protein
MALDPTIFRKSALDRLQNPERLDHLIQVTTPRGWIVLGAFTTVLLAALLWGIFGSMPQLVPALGIMLREGGHFEVQARGGGQVEQLLALPGQAVQEGEVVALISQPQLRLTLRNLERQLEQLQAYRDTVARALDVTTRVDLDALRSQREQAVAAISAAEARIHYLEERERAERQALERGLIIPDVLQGTVSQVAAARDELVSRRVTLQRLEGQAVTTRTARTQQVFELDRQITSLDAQLAAAREEYAMATQVVAPFTGTVVEDLVDVGESVSPGSALFTMDLEQRPLEVYLFTAEGTRVASGMSVQVVPTGISPEENGYLLGDVIRVSELPLGTRAMNRYLRNDALVQSFIGTQGAYLVEVAPRRDESTPTGFAWTTRLGPQVRLGSGTVLSGNILVERRRPITLVIPALQKWLHGA